jgi:hypothetical protein
MKKKPATTQNDRLLAALMKGRRITRASALNGLGVLNLWQRVRELKDLGHDIVCEKTRLRKGGPFVGVYYMPSAARR